MTRSSDDLKLPLLARGLRRRDVLVMGGVAAATPLLSRAARAQDLLAAPAQPISFGYVQESIQFANLRHTAGRLRAALRPASEGNSETSASIVTIVPAGELPSGDPSLSNTPVRLRIAGFFPAVPKAALPQKVDLDVFVKSPENPLGATFFAWSYRKKPENLSAPVAFNVSPDFMSEVTFVLRVQGKNGPASTQRATFTLGDDAGKPRLLRGAYLLAVNARPWDSEVTFVPDLAKANLLSLLVTAEPTAPAD